MKFVKAALVMLMMASVAQAQDSETATFKGESEATAVLVTGNVDTQTYGAKTSNTWNFTADDAAILFGSYLKAKTSDDVDGDKTTADASAIGLRYERVILADQLSGYAQAKYDEDPINGVFDARQSYDIGGKYFIIKNDNLNWSAELGYRYQESSNFSVEAYDQFARGYTEVSSKFNENVSGKLWFEYLNNFENSDKNQWNAEASLSVAMTKILSLKTAYLINHNEAMVSPLKKDTSTWTTAIVAKY